MAKATTPKPAAKTAAKSTAKSTASAKDVAPEKIAKTQIIDAVADKTSLNKKQAGEAVAVMLEVVIEALKEGKHVGLPGLGTFSVAHTAERQGVRPGTSEKITIPAGKKVRFKVASTLKGSL